MPVAETPAAETPVVARTVVARTAVARTVVARTVVACTVVACTVVARTVAWLPARLLGRRGTDRRIENSETGANPNAQWAAGCLDRENSRIGPARPRA